MHVDDDVFWMSVVFTMQILTILKPDSITLVQS